MGRHRLVVDNGSAYIKVGFADSDTPKCVPNLVCKEKRGRACYISSQLQDAPDTSNLAYRRPFEKGYFVDPSTQCDIWKYVFGAEMEMTTEELRATSLLLTAPYFTPRKLQREYNELVFETLEFDEFACVSPAFLSMVSYFSRTLKVPPSMWPFAQHAFGARHKRKREEEPDDTPSTTSAHPCTCVVVDCGYSFSHVVPFVGGKVVKAAVKRVPIGGKVMINHLKGVLSFRQYDMMEEDWLLTNLVNQLCFVSTDFDHDIRISSGMSRVKNDIRVRYMLPSGQAGASNLGYQLPASAVVNPRDQVLLLNNERFTIPELLFNPSDVGFPNMGVAEAVKASVTSSSIDSSLRPLLVSNALLIGGCSMFPGFQERMQADLTALANDDLCVAQCHRDADSLFTPFYGGCELMQSDLYSAISVSRKEYHEQGGDSICRNRIWYDFL